MTSEQAGSQDFVQEGASLARAQCTPAKSRKLLGFDLLFFGSGPIYFFIFFFAIKFYFNFSLRGAWPPCPPPLGYVPDLPIGFEYGLSFLIEQDVSQTNYTVSHYCLALAGP